MALGLLHQAGHNSNWNIDSFEKEQCGDGLILSPLHLAKTNVEKLALKTRTASIFDPQFYLPNSRKPKLLSYPFFPELVDGGFQTSTFLTQVSDVAKSCIDFQVSQQFRKVVVPTRYIDQPFPEYFEQQNMFTVNAFMEHAETESLCMSVALTAPMIQNAAWRTRVLNWVTSFPKVDELYVMYVHERDSKQIQDADFLTNWLTFCSDVINTGLALTVGYTNTEGLLYSAIGDLTITMGSFENTRIFSVDKFLESEGERRGPKARIYLAGLLNWVQFEDAKRIRDSAPKVWDQIYTPTPWAEEALSKAIEPTFNQPQLYKHYFRNVNDQVGVLRSLTKEERRDVLLQQVELALKAYKNINDKGIELEKHGRSGHLQAWKTALASL